MKLEKVPFPNPIPDLPDWRDGVAPEHVALRAALFAGQPRQPEALWELLDGEGRQELVIPIVWALRGMQEWNRGNTASHITNIPVNRVLSHVWQYRKMLRIFEKHFVAKTTPPPISVSEIRIYGESIYDLENGNHRTEAAKMLGQRHIAAEIGGRSAVNPEAWRITPAGLLHLPTGEVREREADVRAAAAWLGVKTAD